MYIHVCILVAPSSIFYPPSPPPSPLPPLPPLPSLLSLPPLPSLLSPASSPLLPFPSLLPSFFLLSISERLRDRVLQLVGRSYSTIRLGELCSLLGHTEDHTRQCESVVLSVVYVLYIQKNWWSFYFKAGFEK